MTDVKASVEYKITRGENSVVIDNKKYKMLKLIEKKGSLAAASKGIGVSYKTILNYISKIEKALNIKLVESTKGGIGGGGGSRLTPEGYEIVYECDKINAIMGLHNEINEIKARVTAIDTEKHMMTIKFREYEISTPMKRDLEVGDDVMALINYDNIVLMLEPHKSSIRNILEGMIVEMVLKGEIIRVTVDVGGETISCDITVSAEKELNLTIGRKVYVGFKAMSVATLKIGD